MTMPKWNELFKEVLIYYSDKKPHINREAKINIADSLNLPEELRREKTAKWKENKLEGRIGFALSALKISGLLEQYEWGSFVITKQGLELINNLPEVLDEKYLIDNYENYKSNFEKNKKRAEERGRSKTQEEIVTDFTPEELVEEGIKQSTFNLANDLLERLYKLDPTQFEYIVADLLGQMGYEIGRASCRERV